MQVDRDVPTEEDTSKETHKQAPKVTKKRNVLSRAKAVNQHCKDCIYDPSNGGNWRQQVEACSVTSCALYPIRPISHKHGDNVEDE